MEEFKSTLINGAKEFGIDLNNDMVAKFESFSEILSEWNKVMNLTAIKEPVEVASKHFVDSLAVLKYADIKKKAVIADVGCGAGFPGHPIKIVRPDLKIVSIDSLGKRLKFLDDLDTKLGFNDCERVHLRAEEAGTKPEFREKFDYAFVRAVAKLRVLCEYCLPLLKVGGEFVAMKGPDAGAEIDEAKNAVKLLGGEIIKIEEYNLPGHDDGRTIIIIKKIKACEKKYPRNSGKIKANPL